MVCQTVEDENGGNDVIDGGMNEPRTPREHSPRAECGERQPDSDETTFGFPVVPFV